MSIPGQHEKVAVVGGGPGGLMCAYMLRKLGYGVTIFEARSRLGGALWLIPEYRLPRNVLSATIDNLIRIAGVDVQYGAKLGDDGLTLEKLKADGYEAVFLANGTPYPREVTFDGQRVEGQELSGVMYGLDFLYEVSHGNIESSYFKGKKVVVIGGGNVAFDAARTARRLGGSVAVIALENEDKQTRDGLPADEEEIKAAWEEGIRIIYSRGVRKIIGEKGKFNKVDCPRCVRVFDEEGRFRPSFDCCDCAQIKGDILIITIGQAPDNALLQKEGLLNEHGRMAVDHFTLQSLQNPSVFIGGDVRSTGFMVEAMKEGCEAAESIHRYLRGMAMRWGRKRDYEQFTLPKRVSYKAPKDVEWIPPEKRLHFQLFENGFNLREAIEEARRCATCGPCISCKACISIGFEKSLYSVEVDSERCSGCRICVYTCNYDAVRLVETEGKLVSETDMFRCKSCGMCVAACPSEARKLVDDSTYEKAKTCLKTCLQPAGRK
jgi:NADPH-dependent glutamate synthase beta subunit-like oxidoreductase